uniref:Uncharacterized protein n=1 Tax=Craspedostauros australis TaxID=1486917 RepID=A0A7R9WMK3_9STRA|mmetsp:Transcript_10271/g.28216  ORF Transcript_10271/g.28216 Transcript_10271/m.28216 type:complete len:150 (+) Transcript_10271:952-1401(+)
MSFREDHDPLLLMMETAREIEKVGLYVCLVVEMRNDVLVRRFENSVPSIVGTRVFTWRGTQFLVFWSWPFVLLTSYHTPVCSRIEYLQNWKWEVPWHQRVWEVGLSSWKDLAKFDRRMVGRQPHLGWSIVKQSFLAIAIPPKDDDSVES